MKMGYNKKLFPMFMTMFLVSVSCGQKRDVTETKKIASESGVSKVDPSVKTPNQRFFVKIQHSRFKNMPYVSALILERFSFPLCHCLPSLKYAGG